MEHEEQSATRLLIGVTRRQGRLNTFLGALVALETLIVTVCSLMAFRLMSDRALGIDSSGAGLLGRTHFAISGSGQLRSSEARAASSSGDARSSFAQAKSLTPENADLLVEGYTIPNDEAFNGSDIKGIRRGLGRKLRPIELDGQKSVTR